MLVVDDDDESRQVVAEYLERPRCRGALAGIGGGRLRRPAARARRRAARRHRHAGRGRLRVDSTDPRRAGADGASIPAAALTALRAKRTGSWRCDAGFQMHLAKPVDPDALVEAVVTLAQRKGAGLVALPRRA